MGHGKKPKIEELFQYSDLEESATPKIGPQRFVDYAEIFATLWPLSLGLQYFFSSHYRTKQQYEYKPEVVDLSVLMGWCVTSWGRKARSIIPTFKEASEKVDLQNHFLKFSTPSRRANDLIQTYIDSADLVPIAVRTPDGILLDHQTLFIFITYLQGCLGPEELSGIAYNSPVFQMMRCRIAIEFEIWLRQEIFAKGYNGPYQPIKPIKKGYKYNILAISENKNLIILIDVKYHNINPSSITGMNLIQQEVLGPHALLEEATPKSND